MKIALTELGTTSESEYGAYDMRMLRALNITGLGPEEVVGTMTNDPDKWDINEQLARIFLTRKDLPDSMSIRLTRGQSRIVERAFCAPKTITQRYCDQTPEGLPQCTPQVDATLCEKSITINDLTTLRDSIQQTQLRLAEAAKLALRQEVLKGTSRALTETPNKKDDILKSLAEFYTSEKFTSIEEVDKALKSSVPVEAQLDAQLKITRNILSKSGIIVTNWERQVEAAGNASATEDLSGGASKKTALGGFLIIGDPRIVSLQLGDDLLKRRADRTRAPLGAEALFTTHRNYITHYQLRAKYVVFAENVSDIRKAHVEADLAGIVKTLADPIKNKINLDALKLKVNALYAAVLGASESGVLDASQGYVRSYPFSMEYDSIRKYVDAQMARSSDTVPIISMRSSLDDFINRADLAEAPAAPGTTSKSTWSLSATRTSTSFPEPAIPPAALPAVSTSSTTSSPALSSNPVLTPVPAPRN